MTARNLLPLLSKNLGDFSNKVRKKVAQGRNSQGRAIQTETSSGKQETAMPRITGLEDLVGQTCAEGGWRMDKASQLLPFPAHTLVLADGWTPRMVPPQLLTRDKIEPPGIKSRVGCC